MANVANIIDTIKNLTNRQKIVYLSGLGIAIASLILVLAWANQTEYQVLFSNLSEADSGTIMERLKAAKVPFKATANGIIVPASKVYELRLQLASEGLPKGGNIGFEVFDKMDFQTTDFVQKLNYRRALEGELARTINALAEIDNSRVHLALPEKTLFVREQEKPSASILVQLKKGRSLSQDQVQGIVHLVSSSVEGLAPKNVTIVDSKGDMLTKPMDEFSGLTTTQLEYKRKYENMVEKAIKDILEPIVGPGKVRAKVTTALDYARTEKTEEKFDPDAVAVRSEQSSSEKAKTSRPGGVPGVQSNLPGKTGGQTSGAQSESQKQSDTTNFEISKVTSHVVGPYGDIKTLSAAVIVDGTYKKKDGSEEMVYAPRAEDEVKRYEDLVKKAIGFNQERGDQVTVANMPFEAMGERLPAAKFNYWDESLKAAKYLAPLIIALMLFLFIVRPLMKSLVQTPPPPSQIPELPVPESLAELSMAREEPEEIEMRERMVPIPPSEEGGIQDEVNDWAEWVKENPAQAALLVREWLEGEAQGG